MDKKDDEKLQLLIDEDKIICGIMAEFPYIYDELNFNEYTVKDRLEKSAYLYQQFRLLSIKEGHNLKSIEIMMDKYIGELYDSLRFGSEKTLTKTEIERYYIAKDEKVIRFKKLYMKQAIRVETFEAIAKAFEKLSWTTNVFVKNMSL